MHVFLIHGMGRTPMSMWILEQRLLRAGYTVSLFGYVVTLATLDTIRDRFLEYVEQEMASSEETSYAVVGHSLGNIITRHASPRLPPGFERFVMLAPPNRPPAIARALKDNWLFRAATRDAGQRLSDDEFYDALPVPDVPSLIIAGTKGPRFAWLPFKGKTNDSIVGLEETFLDDIPVQRVHAAHTFLMNRRDVFQWVDAFLSQRDADLVAESLAEASSTTASLAEVSLADDGPVSDPMTDRVSTKAP